MVGLEEVGSHIAAVLQTTKANTNCKKITSSTSLPCSWLPPTFRSVFYAPSAEINFSNPTLPSQKQNEVWSTGKDSSRYSNAFIKRHRHPTPTEEELQKLYAQLSKRGNLFYFPQFIQCFQLREATHGSHILHGLYLQNIIFAVPLIFLCTQLKYSTRLHNFAFKALDSAFSIPTHTQQSFSDDITSIMQSSDDVQHNHGITSALHRVLAVMINWVFPQTHACSCNDHDEIRSWSKRFPT